MIKILFNGDQFTHRITFWVGNVVRLLNKKIITKELNIYFVVLLLFIKQKKLIEINFKPKS